MGGMGSPQADLPVIYATTSGMLLPRARNDRATTNHPSGFSPVVALGFSYLSGRCDLSAARAARRALIE